MYDTNLAFLPSWCKFSVVELNVLLSYGINVRSNNRVILVLNITTKILPVKIGFRTFINRLNYPLLSQVSHC